VIVLNLPPLIVERDISPDVVWLIEQYAGISLAAKRGFDLGLYRRRGHLVWPAEIGSQFPEGHLMRRRVFARHESEVAMKGDKNFAGRRGNRGHQLFSSLSIVVCGDLRWDAVEETRELDA
jgi:hypothetical protein